jgi:hypothetical protein
MANSKPIDRENVLKTAATEVATLGRTYKDPISGLKGVAVSRTTFLYACVRVAIQPPGLKADGGPMDGFYIDEQLLQEQPGAAVISYEEEPDMIVLGDTYKDSISDFEGVAISLSKFFTSSQRVGLQSSKLHEGILTDVQYFDAHQLSPVKKPKKVPNKKVTKDNGGPGDCAKPPACPRRF